MYMSLSPTHLSFPGCLHIFQKLLIADQRVGKDSKCLRRVFIVHKSDGDVVDVPKVVQLRGKVHISRDENDGRGRRIGVSKPAQALAELVISSILGHCTHMD